MKKPNATEIAKWLEYARALPERGEIVGRGLHLIWDGRVIVLGERVNGLLLIMTPREFTRDLDYVAPQYRESARAIDPAALERSLAAAEPLPREMPVEATARKQPTEEGMRIARYLQRHGAEVYKLTADELQAQVNDMMLRANRGRTLSETEIDQLAAYNMRLEQLRGTSQ